MRIIKGIKDFFKSKEEVEVPKEIPSENVVFNVDSFNKWFCDHNNNSSYANKGIFLRLDKLSQFHIEEYIENSYGIKNCGPFLWSLPTHTMIYNFENDIRRDWAKKRDLFTQKNNLK